VKVRRGLAAGTCAVAVGGRYALDMAWEVGDQWQRGVEVAAAVLCGAVVASFSRDDPPRRPWLLVTIALALVPGIRLASAYGWGVGGLSLQNLLLILGNLVFAAVMPVFARVLGSSDLLSERTGEARNRALLTISAIAACGLAFVFYNFGQLVGHGAPTSVDEWAKAIASAASTLSDAIIFAGGLYLVWLLRPMVGGSLARPYSLMALGGAAFLVLDVVLVSAGLTAQTQLKDEIPKLVGTLAFSCFAAAALVQLALLRAGRRG
jgi:hypothetical protein